MLRAVGMSRRQVRRLVRYESVITALIGAILGTVLGVIFAALVSRPLADEGFELAYPIGTLLVLLLAGRAGRRAGGDLAGAARGKAATCSRRWRTSSGRGAGPVPRMGTPMSPTDRTAAELTERLLAGDKRALARAISLVENDDPEGWALVREVYPRTGKAAVIGFTGPPGVGKSTLIGRLVEHAARARPRGGGALDRPELAVHPRRPARRPDPALRPLPRPGRVHPLDGQPRLARRPVRGHAAGGAADGRLRARTTCSSRPWAWARPRWTSSTTPTPSCSC